MKIALPIIQKCEELIAKGHTGVALKEILSQKDNTIYKNELLTLSNRWEKYADEKLAATLSSIESSLENAKINKALLELLSALKKESESGEIELIPIKGQTQLGTAHITKDGNCCNNFHINGKIKTLAGQPFGFITKVGGIRGDEIFFVYHNIEKEFGLFRGVAPVDSPDSFSMLYFDTVDYLPENVPQGQINFKRMKK